MPNVELPYYVRLIGALGPLFAATATLIVGIIVGLIAYRQWRVAHEKLILDLFDKRFAVYSDARKTVRTYWNEADEQGADARHHAAVNILHEVGRRARFLFDDDVADRIAQVRNALIEAYPMTPWETATKIERERRNQAHAQAHKETISFLEEFDPLVRRYMRITRALK